MLRAIELTVAVCVISSLVCLVQAKKDKISYTYTLWIGDDIDEEYTLSLKSKEDIFFIDAMDRAAAKNSNFIYESTVHPIYGNFITSIAGHSDDKDR